MGVLQGYEMAKRASWTGLSTTSQRLLVIAKHEVKALCVRVSHEINVKGLVQEISKITIRDMSFNWQQFVQSLTATAPAAENASTNGERAADVEGSLVAGSAAASSLAPTPSPQRPPAKTLADSVSALTSSDGSVDPLAVADYISYAVNAGVAITASRVFGYNLEFTSHSAGCVLVTGAASRIGTHAARTLVSMGFTVFAGVPSSQHGARLQQRCARGPGHLVALVLDVTDPQSLRNAYERVCNYIGVDSTTLAESGAVVRTNVKRELNKDPIAIPASPGRGLSRLSAQPLNYMDSDNDSDDDIEALKPAPTSNAKAENQAVAPEDLFVGIINCEGTESPGALEVVPLQEIMRCYEVNTAGAVAVTQCFLPLLRESKGRIINVCSSVGITAAPINGSYAASKMALIAVSESLRVELYPFGISVSIIEPGSLDASSWTPQKKESTSNNHSLQLGSSRTQMDEEDMPPKLRQDSVPSSPTVARSMSRSHMRMSAPPPSLSSLAEDEEDAPYVPPSRKIVNRRGSGSVDENNRPSSPQVFGIVSPPTSPRLVASSIPVPVKPRRSMSAMGSSYTPPRSATSLGVTNPTSAQAAFTTPQVPRPQSVQQMRSRRASTTDPRLDRARASTSMGGYSSQPSSSTNMQHPTWDAMDRSQVAQKLYGPLMETVRDMSDAAAGRVREIEYQERATARQGPRRHSLINTLTASLTTSANTESAAYVDPEGQQQRRRPRGKSVGPLLTQTGTVQRMVDMGVVEESDVAKALTSSCRHVSRAIVHGLTSPFPKTRYRVGWDARATAALRWALPDRFLDWGFVALSGANSNGASSSSGPRNYYSPSNQHSGEMSVFVEAKAVIVSALQTWPEDLFLNACKAAGTVLGPAVNSRIAFVKQGLAETAAKTGLDGLELGSLLDRIRSPAHTSRLALMDPVHVLLAVAAYLVMVFVGTSIMRNRARFEIKTFALVHNLFLSSLSGYMCVALIAEAVRNNYSLLGNPVDPTENGWKMAKLVWLFYISKIVEFVDTLIMVLKKNNRQISFLHMYHHGSVLAVWWFVIYVGPGGEAWFSASLNSFIHVVMYGYYFLSALGFKQVAFIKKYITMMQMTQFCVMMLQALGVGYLYPYYAAFRGLANTDFVYPSVCGKMLLWYMVSMLSLFVNFYIADRKRERLARLEKAKENGKGSATQKDGVDAQKKRAGKK
ncbi:hypothetical protein HDU80_007900 [Chytriomyces hyalinus]|nr:hypothetical protein HDU80_007900 [Chytriomyces hyalinus]